MPGIISDIEYITLLGRENMIKIITVMLVVTGCGIEVDLPRYIGEQSNTARKYLYERGIEEMRYGSSDGKDGKDGKDGISGSDGLDDSGGSNGVDRSSGSDGDEGAAGSDGLDGSDGIDGSSCSVSEIETSCKKKGSKYEHTLTIRVSCTDGSKADISERKVKDNKACN